MPPDDYPGAASKHVLDSEALLAASRFDGASRSGTRSFPIHLVE